MSEEEYQAAIERHAPVFEEITKLVPVVCGLVAAGDSDGLERVRWVDAGAAWSELRQIAAPAGWERVGEMLLEYLASYRGLWVERRELAAALRTMARFTQATGRLSATMAALAALKGGEGDGG